MEPSLAQPRESQLDLEMEPSLAQPRESQLDKEMVPSLAQQIISGESEASSASSFSLTVTDLAAVQSSVASVTVLSILPLSPVITLASVSSTLVKVGDVFALSASLSFSSADAYYCAWTIDDDSLNLFNISLSSPIVMSDMSSPLKQANLVIPPHSLPPRSTLVFSLSCFLVGGNSVLSQSSVTITTLSAPVPGQFSVSPSVGVELSTSFMLLAANWDDQYVPLQYVFGFFDPQRGRMMVARPRSYLAYGSTELPAGSSSRNYTLSCFVSVFNSYLVNTTFLYDVQVTEAHQSATEISVAISAAYETAGNDPDSLTKIVSLYGALLNTVNCSATPNCTARHRLSCSATANTCGSCAEGYTGLDGDSNEACIPLAALSGKFAASGPCAADSDCGYFGSCNASTHQCFVKNKECSDDTTCNGNGQCYYADALSGVTLGSCPVGSVTCVPACRCVYPYVGAFCSLTVDEVASARASREVLLNSLSTLLTIQDADDNSLNDWATSLVSNTQDSLALSSVASLTAMEVCDSIVSQASSYASSFGTSTVALVSAALNNIVDARAVDTTMDTNVTELVSSSIASVTSLLATGMVVGQTATNVVQSNFRLSAVTSSAQSNVSLSSPRSNSEVDFGIRYSSILVGSGSSSDTTSSSGMSLVSLKQSLFSSAFNFTSVNQTSSPTRLILNLADLCARGIDGYDFTFTLNHIEEQTYLNESDIEDLVLSADSTDDAGATMIGECRAGFGGNSTMDCFGSNVTYWCDGIWDYNLTITCPRPVYYAKPSCSLNLDGEQFGPDVCTVISADSWYTVCGCKVCDSSRRLMDQFSHRALSPSDQNLVDIVASSVVGSAAAFVSVMSDPNALTSLSDVLYVVRVIAVFAALWLGLPALWGASTVINKAQFRQEVKSSKRRASVGDYMNAPSRINASKVLVDYALSILPGMYSGENVFYRCWREIKEKVPLFIILTGNSEKFKAYHFPIVLFKMLTTLTYGLFALSFFFTIQYPADDGSCGKNLDESTCIALKSAFDKSVSKCSWVNTTVVTNGVSHSDVYCAQATPVFNAYMNVVMCVLVVLATTPILFILEKLFSEILLAPTASELDGPVGSEPIPKKANAALVAVNKVAGQVRRASINIANQVADAAAALNKHRKHQYKVMEANIVLPPEIIKTRCSAVQVCGDIPVFKAIANEIKTNLAKEVARETNKAAGTGPKGATAVASIHSTMSEETSLMQRVRTSITGNKATGGASPAALTANTRRQLAGEHDWKQLMLDLRVCRKQLKRPEDRQAFDSAWGVESVSKEGVLILSAATRDVLRREYIVAHTRGAQALAMMQQMPRSMCGAELMKLFFVDMIGTSSLNSKILTTSVNEAVLNKKRVVTWGMKCTVIAGLILVNLFFIYSSLLYAANRDMQWQYAWIINAVINIVVELMCGPCLETFVLDCLVPGTISPAVHTAKSDVSRQVARLCDRQSSKPSDRNFPEVTCKYFFASRVVANRRPDLMESSLVHGYETAFPFISDHLQRKIRERHVWHQQQAEKRTRSVGGMVVGGTRRQMTRSWVVNSVGFTMLFTTLLRYLGSLPVPMQKFTMQLTQPLFIGVFGFAFSFFVRRMGLGWTIAIVSLIALGIASLLAYVLYALFRPPSPEGSFSVVPVYEEEGAKRDVAGAAPQSSQSQAQQQVQPHVSPAKGRMDLSRSVASSQAGDSSKSNLSVNVPHPVLMSGRTQGLGASADGNHLGANINNSNDAVAAARLSDGTGSESWDEPRLTGTCEAINEVDEGDEVDSMEFWMDDDGEGSAYSGFFESAEESLGLSLEQSLENSLAGGHQSSVMQEVGIQSDAGDDVDDIIIDDANGHDDGHIMLHAADDETHAADFGEGASNNVSEIDFSDIDSELDGSSSIPSRGLKPLTTANVQAFMEVNDLDGIGLGVGPDLDDDIIDDDHIGLGDSLGDFDDFDDDFVDDDVEGVRNY